MKFNRWLFIILSLSVSKMFASECEQVSKVPCTHTPVWQSFSLSDVKLTSGIFKGAMDLHKGYLLSLDVDRLIPHVRRNVGLTGKNENYGGWETHGGCTYGHYMSACAMMYASTGEKIFRDRLEYMMDELKECQQQTQDGWFISGERAKEGYRKLLHGEVFLNRPDETKQPWNYNQNGNSWYCIHKVLAGLRDVYLYAGIQKAKEILMPLADFIADIALNSNKDLFQSTLSVEQGGMNEVFTDIYAFTGDYKYLETACRFNHINVIYPVANGEDVLFGRHANDQIPKFIGVAKEYAYDTKEIYRKAAENFWDMVVNNHTLAIGGNSCYERFGMPGEESKRLDYSSAETCNTYNMLKLSRLLFMMNGDYKYLNYYEHALFNHILASQDPDMAGCVTYYTSLLPGSFKQYSTPYDSFWCCVGTGMENHAKYAESIYFKNGNSLLINLYIPSELNWKEQGFRLRLDTDFPESDTISVCVVDKGRFSGSVMLRYPEWVEGNPEMMLNGRPVKLEYGKKEYIRLPDSIKSGDTIKIVLPRKLSVRYAKDEPHFGSIMYGPILLAGELGTVVPGSDRVSDNRGLRKELPAQNIPALVGSLADLDEWIIKDSASPLHFTVKNEGKQKDVSLIPYFRMHHQYHTVYWKIYSPDEYAYRRKVLTDVVKIGDEASEKEHQLQGRNDSVYWHDFFWARNARYRMAGDGGWFSYSLAIDKKERNPYYLICRYWGDEPDTHVFDIYVDDKYLETVHLNRKLYLTYVDDVYKIPEAWTHNKSHVNVSFRAKEGKRAGGLYELKITADPDYR